MPSKNLRALDLYAQLCEGKTIYKAEEAERFGVDERSIQRDIDDIRAFLEERRVSNSTDTRQVVYDRRQKGFVLTGCEASEMTNSEILAASKILLESRAFSKKEINSLLNKLVNGCVPQRNMKLVSDLLANERYHYVELKHKSVVKDKLWELGESVKDCSVLEIQYRRQQDQAPVQRIVEPLSVIFSEYYFYLNAFIVERDGEGKLVRKHDYPTVFRIDRIEKYKRTGDKFTVSHASRFEEGEFRKRVQFMYPGNLMKLTFRYTGPSVEAVLDRLPTARIVSEDEKGQIIEAEVYGKGILMWLLSQGRCVKVIAPTDFVEEMKKEIELMQAQYEK